MRIEEENYCNRNCVRLFLFAWFGMNRGNLPCEELEMMKESL